MGIESIDYIFDRYAYLGIAQDTPTNKIAKIIKQKRFEYHPDRVQTMGTTIIREAERQMAIIEKVAFILLNSDRRSFYDQKLAEFRANAPHLISTDGTEKVDLMRPRHIDLDLLLAEKPKGRDEFLPLMAEASGYDEKALQRAKRLHEVMPDDGDLRAMYVDALSKKLKYIDYMVAAVWAEAGVMGEPKTQNMLVDVQSYAEETEAEIERMIVAIPAAVEVRGQSLMLGAPAPRLYLGDGNIVETETFEPPQIVAIAQERFQSGCQAIRDATMQKQEIVATLLDLIQIDYLTPRRNTGNAVIHVVADKGTLASFTVNEDHASLFGFNTDKSGIDRDGLKSLTGDDTEIAFTQLPSVDLIVQVSHVAMTHCMSLGSANNTLTDMPRGAPQGQTLEGQTP